MGHLTHPHEPWRKNAKGLLMRMLTSLAGVPLPVFSKKMLRSQAAKLKKQLFAHLADCLTLTTYNLFIEDPSPEENPT